MLNIHKTRLNDPFMWFMGTNDQPGDYRHSGCAGCHVVYANDREPRHSLTYAQYRPRRADRDGRPDDRQQARCMATRRPWRAQGGDEATARRQHGATNGHGDDGRRAEDEAHGARKEKGHPLRHVFTRAIPTAQCMNCHMHQPNIFLNSLPRLHDVGL